MILKLLLGFALLIALFIIALLIFLKFCPSVGKIPGKKDREIYAQRNDLFYGNVFHNEDDVSTMTKGKSYSGKRKTPKKVIEPCVPELLSDPAEGDLTFTWLGHSSFILQMGKTTVLVDPVLSGRSSPVGFAGPKRFSGRPFTFDTIPYADILFISHDHYDHLDYKTILKIRDKVGKIVVPLGVDVILKGWGVDPGKIITVSWWENISIGDLKLTLTPSRHFTGRNPLKGNSTLWGGLYLTDGHHSVYYTGDGGYYDVFEKVKKKLGPPDLMIAECGQYDPAWALIHMFPEQAVRAGLDAGASRVIPVHWGTFCICNTDWDDSVIRFTKEAGKTGLNVSTPRIGQTVVYERTGDQTDSWYEEYA